MEYPKVIEAKPLPDYQLELVFTDGRTRRFDVSRYFEYPVFQPLQDTQFFNTVFVERGRPMWGDKSIDISPNMLTDSFNPNGFVD